MNRKTQALLVFCWLAATLPAASTQTNDEAAKLHRLFDEEWEWTLREYPEYATSLGDNRYNDKLTDLSAEAIALRKEHERAAVLNRIREIDRSRLTGQDTLSYDLFLREAEQNVPQQQFPRGRIPSRGSTLPSEWMPVSQMHGVHLDIPALPRTMAFRVAKDYDNFLARLSACPKQIEQIIEIMKRSIASGWMLPALPMGKVPAQIVAQIHDDVTKSPLYKPLESFPKGVNESERSRLTMKTRQVIMESVLPALKGLDKFIKKATSRPAGRILLLPICPAEQRTMQT